MTTTRNFVLETMYNWGWKFWSIDLFPRVNWRMTKKDFFDYNENLIYEVSDKAVNEHNNNYELNLEPTKEDVETETDHLYDWMMDIAKGINKVSPSRIKTFVNEHFAKAYMNTHYKNHWMLFFPVWEKTSNQFLLFYVGQR